MLVLLKQVQILLIKTLYHLLQIITKHYSQRIKKTFEFCSKNLQEIILKLIIKYFHLHSLIPNDNNEYFIDEIWIASVKEMYNCCVKNDLRYVWTYM